APMSKWELHAVDGTIRLGLPDSFAADVDLHTSDGHISLDVPITVEGRLGQNNIHGKLNGGGKLLTIHTGDGAIRLQKSMGTAFKFQMPGSGFSFLVYNFLSDDFVQNDVRGVGS